MIYHVHEQFSYLIGECGVLIDVLYLVVAEVCVNGAAVLRDAVVAVADVLGQFVVIAMVVLPSDGVTLEHRIDLGGTLQRCCTVSPPGRWGIVYC